jgi:hypothetical protein
VPDPSDHIPGKVGRNHPGTSYQAADNVAPSAASQRMQILQIMRSRPDWTCYEVAQITGRAPNQEATRLQELREMDRVEYVLGSDGKVLKRSTSSPRYKAMVQRLKRPRLQLVRVGRRTGGDNGNQERTLRRQEGRTVRV